MTFFQELKRRNVFRVGIAYVLMGWVLLQGADFVLDLVGGPNWVIQALSIAVVLGLPIALIFAWIFEITPEGVKRESEIDRSESIAPHTGRKLNYVTIGVLLIAVLFMVVERLFFAGDPLRTEEANPQAMRPGSAAVSSAKSIAVLPFRDMSAAGDQAYFGEGIAEELLNALVKLDELKVASRTSSFSLVKQDLDIPTIAARLDVNHILEGSIRTSGRQVRVTAQLIEVQEDAHLWSQTFNGTLDDIFKIQDEITGQIISALEVQLAGSQVTAAAEVLTDDPEAYRLYLRGRHLWRQRSVESLREAESLLQQALDRDPGFHQAWASLALVYFVISQYDYSFDEQEARQKGLAAAEQALLIEPDSAEALLATAGYMEYGCRLSEAVTMYEKIIEVSPRDPTAHHWLALVWNYTGSAGKAKEEIDIAHALDPLITAVIGVQGEIEMTRGNYEEARELHQRAASMGFFGGNLFDEGYVALHQGDIAAAKTLMSQGRTGDDEALIEEVRLFFAALEDPSKRPEFHEHIGSAGEKVTFPELDTVMLLAGSNDPYLFDFLAEADCPPVVDDLWAAGFREQRGKPEFLELMKRAGAVELWQQRGWPDDCTSVYGCPE